MLYPNILVMLDYSKSTKNDLTTWQIIRFNKRSSPARMDDNMLRRYVRALYRQQQNPRESRAAGGDAHLLRFNRAYDDHLLRFNRAYDDHLLRFNRAQDDHLLRFNKRAGGANQDAHLLRFNRAYDDHLLR